MSGTIPPPSVTSSGNAENPSRVEDVFQTDNPNNTGTNNVAQNVLNENDLILSHEGPSDIRDTKIAAVRLKFNAFNALEGEKVKETYTRLNFLLNELENKDVKIPQAEVNATFVNNLPKKGLCMNQTQRANNFIKNDTLATMYGKYKYEEELIDQIYESENVKENIRSINEFLADLNAEFPDRALLANQKSKVTVDQLLTKQVSGNIVCALGGRGPLPPLPKLSGVEPIGNQEKDSNQGTSVLDPCPDKKAESSTEQLLLTLIKKLKGLKEQIKPLSTSQNRSSKSIKGKQKTRFGPCKYCGLKSHLIDGF
uniref:Uncharacterized protein n=1 Tax=Tanacetum cinerariifolium TaxID=118510 RepID=A0A6L2M4A0_TANCI|nr:hypothetical protein [Tanacetum cinerariifolium]